MTQTYKRIAVLNQMLMAILSLISTPKLTMGAQEALKAKGFDDSCKVANELMNYGNYAETTTKTITTDLFEVEAILHDLKKLMKSGALARTEENLNLLMHTENTVEEAKLAVQTHLSDAIGAGNEGAFIAGAILESTRLFFTVSDGNHAYCMSNSGGSTAASIADIKNCSDGADVLREFRKAHVDELSGIQPELKRFEDSRDRGKTVSPANKCRLGTTDKTSGLLGQDANNENAIYVMAGLLKIDKTGVKDESWAAGHDEDKTNPISKFKNLQIKYAVNLDRWGRKLKELAKIGGGKEKGKLGPVSATRKELGIGDTNDIVEISVETIKSAQKAIQALREAAVKEQQTGSVATKRAQLTQQITPAPAPAECKPIASEDDCNKIKIEAECNATAACSYNQTETDNNKKCKLDTEKAKKKSVSVTQMRAGGPETTTEKCKDKKSEAVCKDGCKWEDNSCKDSSILVTKTFALSVVSAAFAALLF